MSGSCFYQSPGGVWVLKERIRKAGFPARVPGVIPPRIGREDEASHPCCCRPVCPVAPRRGETQCGNRLRGRRRLRRRGGLWGRQDSHTLHRQGGEGGTALHRRALHRGHLHALALFDAEWSLRVPGGSAHPASQRAALYPDRHPHPAQALPPGGLPHRGGGQVAPRTGCEGNPGELERRGQAGSPGSGFRLFLPPSLHQRPRSLRLPRELQGGEPQPLRPALRRVCAGGSQEYGVSIRTHQPGGRDILSG